MIPKPVGFRPLGLLASAAALAEFDQMWEMMWLAERVRVVRSLVAGVTYSSANAVQVALSSDTGLRFGSHGVSYDR